MRCRSGKVRWKTKMSNDTAAEELVAPTSWMCVATKSDNGLSAKVEIYHGNILWLPIEDEAGPKSRRRPGSLLSPLSIVLPQTTASTIAGYRFQPC